MPLAASAAGLGKMTVMSGLGEPLNAEIEIAANKEELSSLTARIAPSEIYAEQSIERASSLNGVKVELSRKSDGTPILKLSSLQPVNDPFLDMLIQVDWPTGRLLREYTALLDPPGYGDRTMSAEGAVEGKQLPTVATPTKKNTSKSAARSINKPQAESGDTPADSYVTKRGDTLRNVARKMQVDDVTLEQMLVGLFQANRNAFVSDNMNQLKVGQIMRKPRDEELRAITPEDALQEVRIHTSNWNAYRNDVAQAVAQSQGAPAEVQPQSSGGKIAAQAEDKSVPPATGPRDVVKLSKIESAGAQKAAASGSGSGSAGEEKLRALEEESTAQDKAIAEVNERIAFFEKQIQDMQKLLLVQNQILADLQKGAPENPEAPTETPPAAEAPQAAQQPPAEAAAPAAPPQPKRVPPPAEPVAEPNIMDDLLQDPMMLAAGGGVLALLLGGWLFTRRTRKKNLDSFEKSILTSSGLKTDTVFGTTGGAAVDTGETSFLTDFSHRGGAGMIDTSDVDPISEAEVYMAYGRDAQAEEILKDAIAKEPKRYELHLKLLEIYSNRKDAVAFETLAGELYASLGTSDPVWRKVAEMGHALEPENPMYAITGDVSNPSSPSPSMAMPAAAAGMAAAALAADSEPASEEPSVEETPDNGLDFDLGMLAGESDQSSTIETEPDSVESEPLPDLGAFSAPANESAEPATEGGMDLQFELPEPAAFGTTQLDAGEVGLPEEGTGEPEKIEEISFDLPALDASSEPASALSAFEKPEESSMQEDFSLPDLTLPSAQPEVAVPEEQADAVEEISFDLPELAIPETEAPAVEVPDASAASADASVTDESMAAFDLELPEIQATPQVPEQPEMAAMDLSAFELPEVAMPEEAEVASPEPQASTPEVEEIVFEEPAKEEESPLDFNFSLDVESEGAEEVVEPAAPVPDLDLSGISLDIAEPVAETPEPAAEEITLSAGEESADVDTKLDLVTAYMDMGDTEGARELLEEVLQEGGPKQRERAQKMLDSLA